MLAWPTRLELRMSESQNPSMQNGGSHNNAEEIETERLRERHAEFIESLERHGPNFTGEEWPILAEELGWSVEEVQMHAYQYLACLMEADGAEQSQVNQNGGSRARIADSGTNGSSEPWSPAECVLFDTLIAVYRTSNGHGEPVSSEWDEAVASHLSGRTSRDVRLRYRHLQGNSNGQFD
jgi:hypothetical protein